jgi:hypothetical protein
METNAINEVIRVKNTILIRQTRRIKFYSKKKWLRCEKNIFSLNMPMC